MPLLECLVDHLGSVSCCLMKSRSLQWDPDGETGSLAMAARSCPDEISLVCMQIQNSISWKSQTNQVVLRFSVTGLNTGKRFILPWGNKHFFHTSILAQKGLGKHINSVNRLALGMFVLLQRINFLCTLCTSTYIQTIDMLMTNDVSLV